MVSAPMTTADPPRFAIIIPALNEAATLPALLGDLASLSVAHEILVADGGSSDSTVAVARDAGARVISAPRGRGAQMAAAARDTPADVLCFLHSDVRLSTPACQALEHVVSGPLDAAWAYRLRIDAAGWGYRLIEVGANFRSRILKLPYGDQGLIVSREAYEASGGFLPLPLMEDVTFVRALRRTMPVRLLSAAVTVSPRRWQRDGLAVRTLANWTLLAAWLLGASPTRLARWYRAEAPRGS